MTRNNNIYKWFAFNNDNGSWGLYWKDGHDEWKNKPGKKSYVLFSNPAKKTIIYCSYLMTTSDDYTEEEEKCGDNSQNNDFIYLSLFELLK